MTRTILFGLDGLDPQIQEDFDLPNIRSIGEGFTIDTHGNSGPSWASVLTGEKPRVHGVEKLEPQQSVQSWQGTPIWEKIDGYSGIANVPLTYPPQEIPGWMITGLFTPKGAIYTYPRRLYQKLDELDYRIDVWVDDHKNHPHGHFGTIPFEFSQDYREELLSELEDVLVNRGTAFKWLVDHEPVDFMFLCFTSLDRVQHLAIDDMATVRRFYELLDEQVGRVLESLSADTDIFVTSDHGFQEIDIPRTDVVGEHRVPGYGATSSGERFRNLEDLHRQVVESANRDDVEGRLQDLGYIE